MTGQPNVRQPRSGQAVKQASNKAQRQLAMMQQRAKAASSKAVALSLLSMEFGQKIADAHRTQRGPALEAALAALMLEQRAAERGLVTKLAGEAADERKALAQQFRTAKRPAAGYKSAAKETTRRGVVQPGRPRNRQRGTRAPRLRR